MQTRASLLTALSNFTPYNEEERQDIEAIQLFLVSHPRAYERVHDQTDPACGHVTSSVHVCSPHQEHHLLNWVTLYNRWQTFGGHADGEEDIIKVAGDELEQESGIPRAHLNPSLFDVCRIPVLPHIRKGQEVPAHTHYNFTFLAQPPVHVELKMAADESKELKWVSLTEAIKLVEPTNYTQRILEKIKNGYRCP